MNNHDFGLLLSNAQHSLRNVDGWLSEREVQFLVLAGAVPTATGDILEIGSFRGRSTIALALANRFANVARPQQPSQLIAIDPMDDNDPLLDRPLPSGSSRATFDANLARANVQNEVEFHQAFSYEVAPNWTRPLRLLWIDGDHAYASTRQDYDLYAPYLADGAIIALHDVLSPYDGCIRVFCENILSSPHFGAAGLCGSIGWAQFWSSRTATFDETQRKHRLQEKLAQLLPYHCGDRPLQGLQKLRYKWLRARVPHRQLNADRWQEVVGCTA